MKHVHLPACFHPAVAANAACFNAAVHTAVHNLLTHGPHLRSSRQHHKTYLANPARLVARILCMQDMVSCTAASHHVHFQSVRICFTHFAWYFLYTKSLKCLQFAIAMSNTAASGTCKHQDTRIG